MRPYGHFGPRFLLHFLSRLQNREENGLRSADMGASAKDRSLRGQTLEENSNNDFQKDSIVISVLRQILARRNFLYGRLRTSRFGGGDELCGATQLALGEYAVLQSGRYSWNE